MSFPLLHPLPHLHRTFPSPPPPPLSCPPSPLPLVLPSHPRPSIAPAPVIRYAAQPSTGSPEQSTTITSFIVTSSVTVQVHSQCAACLTYSAQTTPPSDGRSSCAALLAAQISHNPLDSLILTSPNPPFWTPSRRHLAAAIGRGILDVSCLTTSSRILLLSSYCLHTLLLRRLFSAAWLFGAFARLLWTVFFFYGPYHVVVCLLPTTYWIPARQLHTVCSTSLFYCSISSHASSSPAAFAFSLHPPKKYSLSTPTRPSPALSCRVATAGVSERTLSVFRSRFRRRLLSTPSICTTKKQRHRHNRHIPPPHRRLRHNPDPTRQEKKGKRFCDIRTI